MLLICIILMVGVSIGCWYGINNVQERERKEQEVLLEQENSGSGPEQWQKEGAPYIDVELLTPNEYSRPQIPIESVKYIAIHYTANPGATAMANRNYFENLANTHETKVSSHFVIGLDGEVVQCIPTSEISYATNSRNVDTVSIECCHQDEIGKFSIIWCYTKFSYFILSNFKIFFSCFCGFFHFLQPFQLYLCEKK